ncbi:MAG: MFS transporter [Desulfobacteraceae bacterium]|jgi:sugar phosphate permease
MSKRTLAIIIAGFFTVFIAFAVRYAYGLLLPAMLPALAITKTQAGVVYSSYFIAYTVFSPVLGLIADRYDARFILTFFVGLLGLGAFLMSYSSSVSNASFFFALAGFGHSACWAPVVALIQRWVSDKRRGIALAFTDMGSATGIAVWSGILPLIVATYHWRTGWTSLGMFAFLVAVMNFLLVRNPPEQASSSPHPTSTLFTHETVRETYKRLLYNRTFWLIGLSYLAIAFSILIPFTFLSIYVAQGLEMPYEAATRLIAVIAIAGVLGKLVLGHLSDTLGRIRVMILCGALVATGCLGLAYFQRYLILVLCTFIFGIGYGAIWPVYAASAVDFFSKGSAGAVVGLWTIYLGVGSMISPVVTGWTIDVTGGYGWAFILAMMSAVISLLLLLPISKSSDS